CKVKQFGSVDIKYPRLQAAKLEGLGARVQGAQDNAWEALAVFTAAVFMAHFAGADPKDSAMAAQIFIAARIAHPIIYMMNIGPLRTLAFVVALGACIWLFVLAANAPGMVEGALQGMMK
ncbi:MAG: MAPEG family protein, partial [Gammaproteobacteria bacterium]